MKLLKKIFSITNSKDKLYKIIYILGIKIKIKRKCDAVMMKNLITKTRNQIILGVQRSINTALLHQRTFLPYKNMYQGKTIVLVGAGPTVNYFEPIKDAIYVGCNRAFLFDKVKFDYLFSIDKVGIDQYYKEYFEYEGNNCIKFLGDQNIDINYQIPESYILKFPQDKIKRYKTTAGYLPSKCTLDIDSEPLGNFPTVSLQAMQFILYTNPAKVYIVGIDCTVGAKGHFKGKTFDNKLRNEDVNLCNIKSIKGYNELKNFADMYYPGTEIVCVNPVGLKGIFNEVYTKSYLEANPDIKEELQNNYILLEEN